MEDYINNIHLALILDTIIYVITAYFLFFIGKLGYTLTHRSININEELVQKDNLAFAISNVGYYVGLLLAIGSAIIGESNGLLLDIIDILIYGLLAIVLLNISSLINDKVILNKFSIHKEIIEDQNAGTGVVEAANFVAGGLIILGSVAGKGINMFPDLSIGYTLSGILTAVSFWFVGQVVMLLSSYIYNFITPYNIHEHIEKDNVAVGIGFAGAMIAMAILISHGISGDFYSWSDHFYKIGIEILIGMALLPAVRLIADKVLLPGERLTDEIINQEHPNIGAALIEAFAYIGGALLITWCL